MIGLEVSCILIVLGFWVGFSVSFVYLQDVLVGWGLFMVYNFVIIYVRMLFIVALLLAL